MATRAKGSDSLYRVATFFFEHEPYMCTYGQGNTLNSVLYEAWADCAGDWTKSKLYMTLKDKHSKKRQGKRVWLTYKELVSKFGDAAEDIVERKLGDADLKAKEVRPHPDAPGSKDIEFGMY